MVRARPSRFAWGVRDESGLELHWRDAAAYAPLIDADPSLIAWEWLRRDPLYRQAASCISAQSGRHSQRCAAAFGLVAFERPGAAVPAARPLWRLDACASVLSVEVCDSGSVDERFDLSRFESVATLVAGERTEHLLLSDGLRAIRLDAPNGTLSSGPVTLQYRLHGLSAAQSPLLALRRFLALSCAGRFAASLHRRSPRARRWILALRAWDALCAGADQRQIAMELLSSAAAGPRWRIREPSVRSRAQRLVRSARALAGGHYRALLWS